MNTAQNHAWVDRLAQLMAIGARRRPHVDGLKALAADLGVELVEDEDEIAERMNLDANGYGEIE